MNSCQWKNLEFSPPLLTKGLEVFATIESLAFLSFPINLSLGFLFNPFLIRNMKIFLGFLAEDLGLVWLEEF